MPHKAADSTVYSAVGHPHYSWEPGRGKLPYRGFGALFLSVAGVVVAIIVLLVSDGADVNHWRFQPAVYVAVASTITNICVVYALMEGVSISWWCKALRNGTTVADLHHIWAFGSSFVSALFCGRHVNLVAVASLLVAIGPINGPLLQRASTIGPAYIDSTRPLQIEVAQRVPEGFTGLSTGRARDINMLTTKFSPIARGFYNKAPVPFQSGCIDKCSASILGAGFHANCSTYQAPFNATQEIALVTPKRIFGASLAFLARDNPITASLNIEYKAKAGCLGELTVKNCSLTAGTVLYDVVIDGPASTIALAPGTTIWDDIVIGPPDYLYEGVVAGPSTYGGIFLALANRFNTDLSIEFGGGIGYEYDGAQTEVSISYARNVSDHASCDISFSDPTEDFLQASRELMFRTAVLSANETDTQRVSVQATGSHTVYHTNYLFVTLATIASLVPIIAVLLTFRGSQRLGREVSLSPIEVAKAFGAPVLRGANSNARASALVKQVGHRPIKYGVISDMRIARKPVRGRPSRASYTDEIPYSNGNVAPHSDYSTAIPMTSQHSASRSNRAPYADEVLYANDSTVPDHSYSNAIPTEPEQLVNRSSRTLHVNDSPHNDIAPDYGFSNAINPQPHISWQSGYSSGFESDRELMDPRQRSDTSRAWLGIDDPKNVTLLKKGMSFSDW